MDVSAILDKLNEAQRAAVAAPLLPTLVLAGAGSGKTRVLTHRVAWLIQAEGVSPHSVLAVTFTNKGAGEMRGRIESLLGVPAGVLWVGTFHGIAHRLLRLHWREARLPQNFQILDAEDQQRMVRKVLKSLSLDEARYPPREITWFINAQKDEGLRPKDLRDHGDPARHQRIRIYQAYTEACERAGVVDFAELLLQAYETWRDNADLLAHYRRRFRHVLVDEFQDTNAIQYEWLKLLAGGGGSTPFVVGDDDQSIYRWRGARVENIHQFQRDFTGTQLFKLEQNYRSTGTILTGANALIAHNTGRMGKTLWTQDGHGAPIRVYAAFNERDEADFVLNRIREYVRAGGKRSEVAILYRSNAQSRVFEEAFLSANIPYRVYGGLRFFERAEIKDALAYLRLTASRDDDTSFERVVNLPTRGIGAKSMEIVREHARTHGCSLWHAAAACVGPTTPVGAQADAELLAPQRGAMEAGTLGPKAAVALSVFLALIERLSEEIRHFDLHEQVDRVIQRSGLIEHFQKEAGERGEARVENLHELVSAARTFAVDPTALTQGAGDAQLNPLDTFLAHAALEAGEGQAAAWEDCVQMMTLHSAKGLEFPLVFMCGLEDGIFPNARALNDIEGLEEERRLCYVGMTRAMRELNLTFAELRRLHGADVHGQPSRFIAEVPPELVEEVRPRIQISRPARFARGFKHEEPEEVAGMRLGQRVRHGKFGEGVVLNLEGQGAHARVQVNFERQGAKWLMVGYANLELM